MTRFAQSADTLGSPLRLPSPVGFAFVVAAVLLRSHVAAAQPSPDRDHDGVPDAQDACPSEPGAQDLNPRRHGCPYVHTVILDPLEGLHTVYFAAGAETPAPRSRSVLDAIARVLHSHPEIRRVSLRGHRTGRELDARRDLASRRADAVRAYLVRHGIAPERLIAESSAPQSPATPEVGDGPYGRRVEVRVVEPR